MLLSSLIDSIGFTLQDSPHTRWTTPELIVYINEGIRDIASRTYAFEAKDTFTMDALTQSYTLTKMPVKIKDVSTSTTEKFTYAVTSAQVVTFDNPKDGVTITVEYYCVPTDVTVLTVNLDLYHNLTEALRNFVLARCYSKDETTENFNKMALYEQRYIATLSENMNGVGTEVHPTLYQKDFY